MKIDYAEILHKLNKMNSNRERLKGFDETFHIVLLKYAKEETILSLVKEGGSIHLENLKRKTDKLGMGTLSFYSPSEDKCTMIPTKDTLLLMALGLGMEIEDADKLLKSAGYGSYMKNLREFIIYVGLRYKKSLDQVSEKLLQYGYRENAALENVEYRRKDSNIKEFSRGFKEMCQKKGLSEKKVLENAQMVSPEFEADRNRYYSSAFNGTKAVQVVLDYHQVIRLLEALMLTNDEKRDYTESLQKLRVIQDNEKRLISAWIQSGIKKEQEVWHREKIAHVMKESVFTHHIASGMKTTDWDRMDDFITDHFGYIRSFAIFYQRLLDFEGYGSAAKFCKTFKLSDRSHYSYLDSSSLPELSHLTALCFLMKKMTIQIYNTLLKKSGKLAYEEDEESAIYIIAKNFLQSKTEEVVLFGALYDFIESLVLDQEENLVAVQREELNRLYFEVSKIVSRNLRSYVKETQAPANEQEINFIEDLVKENCKELNLNYSEIVARVTSQWDEGKIQEFRSLLKNRLGFEEESYLMMTIGSLPEITEELDHG